MFTKANQLFSSKPMSRRRQLSLAWSAIAKQETVGDESDPNVDSPSNGRSNAKSSETNMHFDSIYMYNLIHSPEVTFDF